MPKIAEFATVVLDLVAEELDVPKEQILSKSRMAEVVDARHTAVKLLHSNNVYPAKIAAAFDVSQIAYTDKEGKKHTGAYWTCEQVEEATKAMSFPSGTTKWDKFVAFNSFFADTCKVLTEEQTLKTAYQFYFADEDFPKERGAKIWLYMAMVHGL